MADSISDSGGVAGALGDMKGTATGAAAGTAIMPGVGTVIGAGAGLVTDMLNLALNYGAQQDQQYATRLNDAEQGAERKTARVDQLEEKQYNRKQTATSNAFAEMVQDQGAAKEFAGNLQNYLNSDQKAAEGLISIWKRR